MTGELAFPLLVAGIAVGSYGWGSALCWVLFHRLNDTARERATVRIAIGLAFFIAIAGLLVAADSARFGALIAVPSVGVALVPFGWKRRPAGAPQLAGWLHYVLLAAAGSVCALIALIASSSPGWSNPNDDDAAYYYLAKRLLVTGGMIDPFNLRRISSYGGGELFSALGIRVTGPGAALAFEWFGWALLGIALFVGQASRRWAPGVVLVLGGAIVLVRPIGDWANSAPTFSGVALLLALFTVLAAVRDDSFALRRYLVVGLFLAALLAMRLEFVTPGVIASLVVAARMLPFRRALKAVGCAAGVGVAAIAGWAVALQRSSRTPLFPLFSGNFNTRYPWLDPSFRSTGQLLRRFFAELGSGRIGITLVAAAVALVISLALDRRKGEKTERRAAHAALLGGIVGVLVEIAAETRSLDGGTLYDIARYDAPEALAVLLFAVALLWQRFGPARCTATPTSTRAARICLAVISAALAGVAFGSTPRAYTTAIRTAWVSRSILSAGGSFNNPWPGEQFPYDDLSSAVPPGSHLLAAVDQPALLDFSRYTFATLDIVGATSPSPGIPILSGERAVVAYLRRLGFTGIVASLPTSPGLYEDWQWRPNLSSTIADYHVEARYFFDWYSELSAMKRDPSLSTKTLGQFLYVSLRPQSLPQIGPESINAADAP